MEFSLNGSDLSVSSTTNQWSMDKCDTKFIPRGITSFTKELFEFSLSSAAFTEYTDKQVAFQSNANHPLAESMGYIKFEEM